MVVEVIQALESPKADVLVEVVAVVVVSLTIMQQAAVGLITGLGAREVHPGAERLPLRFESTTVHLVDSLTSAWVH